MFQPTTAQNVRRKRGDAPHSYAAIPRSQESEDHCQNCETSNKSASGFSSLCSQIESLTSLHIEYINQHVDSLNESDVTVEVLAHVAQRILGPPFLWAQTADLLGLLAHLERLRVATVEQAGMALAAIEQYSGSPSFHIKIPPDIEVDALRAMADNDTSSVRRSEYHHFKLQIRWMVS